MSFAELDPSVRHLLYKKMHEDDSVSPSTSAEPKAKRAAAALEQWTLGYGEAGETVVFLETLTKLCNHGKQCCNRAMISYKIALVKIEFFTLFHRRVFFSCCVCRTKAS